MPSIKAYTLVRAATLDALDNAVNSAIQTGGGWRPEGGILKEEEKYQNPTYVQVLVQEAE